MCTGGLLERRTRVTTFLPTEKPNDTRAVLEVLRFLRNRRTSGIGGFTTSLIRDPSFTGWWWDEGNWVYESVVFMVIDYDLSSDDEKLEKNLGDLHRAIHHAYEKYDRPQQEIWMIAERATRYTYD